MKYESDLEGNDGWSEWVLPTDASIYKMACCDCGLVHDMEFEVVKPLADLPDGYVETEVVESKEYRVVFRVRRNNRSTGQMRRKK